MNLDVDYPELSVIEEGLQILEQRLRKAHEDFHGPQHIQTPYGLRHQSVIAVRQKIKELVWGKQ